jgi:hypothetical protein
MTLFLSIHASQTGLLLEVKNNSLLYFSVNNYEHLCIPYGVVTFEMLRNKSKDNALCQKNLNQYFEMHPQDQYLARRHFHLQQYYSFEMRGDRCVIYAQGKKRYAQILLERGLAIVPIGFDDRVLDFGYRRLENEAKREKKGLWSDPVLRNCMKQLEL